MRKGQGILLIVAGSSAAVGVQQVGNYGELHQVSVGIVAAAHGGRYKRGQGQGYEGDATSETPECTFLKLESKAEPKFMHDSSTNNLISRYRKYRQAP